MEWSEAATQLMSLLGTMGEDAASQRLADKKMQEILRGDEHREIKSILLDSYADLRHPNRMDDQGFKDKFEAIKWGVENDSLNKDIRLFSKNPKEADGIDLVDIDRIVKSNKGRGEAKGSTSKEDFNDPAAIGGDLQSVGQGRRIEARGVKGERSSPVSIDDRSARREFRRAVSGGALQKAGDTANVRAMDAAIVTRLKERELEAVGRFRRAGLPSASVRDRIPGYMQGDAITAERAARLLVEAESPEIVSNTVKDVIDDLEFETPEAKRQFKSRYLRSTDISGFTGRSKKDVLGRAGLRGQLLLTQEDMGGPDRSPAQRRQLGKAQNYYAQVEPTPPLRGPGRRVPPASEMKYRAMVRQYMGEPTDADSLDPVLPQNQVSEEQKWGGSKKNPTPPLPGDGTEKYADKPLSTRLKQPRTPSLSSLARPLPETKKGQPRTPSLSSLARPLPETKKGQPTEITDKKSKKEVRHGHGLSAERAFEADRDQPRLNLRQMNTATVPPLVGGGGAAASGRPGVHGDPSRALIPYNSGSSPPSKPPTSSGKPPSSGGSKGPRKMFGSLVKGLPSAGKFLAGTVGSVLLFQLLDRLMSGGGEEEGNLSGNPGMANYRAGLGGLLAGEQGEGIRQGLLATLAANQSAERQLGLTGRLNAIARNPLTTRYGTPIIAGAQAAMEDPVHAALRAGTLNLDPGAMGLEATAPDVVREFMGASRAADLEAAGIPTLPPDPEGDGFSPFDTALAAAQFFPQTMHYRM